IVPGVVILQAGVTPVRSIADIQAEIARARAAGREEFFILAWSPDGNGPVLLDVPRQSATRSRAPATTQ
ncbi:MAG TPA: hypothetical protein DCX75_07895, partial [Brevundimonas sp.]|nr:hypothetical protein [Brevundimonas sp.]